MANWQVISLDTTTPQLRAPGTGDGYSFNSGSTQLGVWTTTGLGIGTASPSNRLDVIQSAGGFTGIRTNSQSAAQNSDSGLRLVANCATVHTNWLLAAQYNAAGFEITPSTAAGGGTFSTPAFFVSTTSNVGIGTTSPTYKLDTNNTSAGTIARFVNGAGRGFVRMDGYDDMTLQFYRRGASTAFIQTDSSGTEFVAGTTGAYPFILYTNNTERARITSSGNLLLGTTTAAYSGTLLNIGTTSDSQNGVQIQTSTTGIGYLLFGDGSGADAYRGEINYAHTSDSMAFKTVGIERARISSTGGFSIGTATDPGAGNTLIALSKSYHCYTTDYGVGTPSTSGLQIFAATGDFISFSNKSGASFTERARISATGDFFVAKTSQALGPVGHELRADGLALHTASGASPLFINRLTSDGDLVRFYQDTVEEGSISVSGNTVSYNAFAGSHWSQLQDGSKPDILRGTVMESINELCAWPDENNERLPKAKISDTAGSKKVYGVFMAWDNDWTGTNDMYVTAVGAFICRVNGSVTVEEGDLLESNGDGTARVQADDIIRSSTIGKVTSTVKTHEYDDGSYCVPTVLYCG